MAEYDVNFGQTLANVASQLTAQTELDDAGMRTVAYLSLLSIEINLKAILEKAGVPLTKIRSYSHSLSGLLDELKRCEVQIEILSGSGSWVSASRIRAIDLQHGHTESSIGEIIERSDKDASTYPNQIRYGAVIKHFEPNVLALAAMKISEFVQTHWNTCRVNVPKATT